METVFVKVLNLSLQASILALAVMLVRAATARTRFPKWALVLMWGLVGLRLLCPFSVESALSLLPSREVVRVESTGEGAVTTVETGIPALDGALGGAPSHRDPAPSAGGPEAPAPPEISGTAGTTEPERKADALGTALYWASRVWPAGTACMLLYFIASALLLRRRVAGSEETEEGVWESERVPSPFVFGFLRPRIYLPWGLREEHREFVLAHERAHIKRRDHMIKPLAFFILAFYWFNPLLWVAYVLLTRDIELACDERVLKELGPRAKRPYSEALLAAVTFHRYVAACPVAFGEGKLKGRVKNVLRWKKPAVWLTAAAVLLCAVLGACFLTSPARGEETPDPSEDPGPTEDPVSALAGSYKFAGEYPDSYGPNIFTLRLYGDGTFQYYETTYSSHIGLGTWAYEDGVVTLTEERSRMVGGTEEEISEGVFQMVGGTMEDYEAHIRLRVTEDGLAYLAEGSDNFYYIEVQDGDPFLRETGDVTWSFEDGVLTLSGSGTMEDYGYRYEGEAEDGPTFTNAPWGARKGEITSVVVKEGVTSIGTYAFYGLENLASVTLPSGLTVIGQSAFADTALAQVTLPESLQVIQNGAFSNTKLTKIAIPAGTELWAWVFAGSTLEEVTLAEGTAKIDPWVFASSANLAEIHIPDSVTEIGAFAFKGCAALKTVRIPAGMTEIGHSAFRESGLTEIDIPSGITAIADSAFADCSALRRVTVPAGVRSIGAHAFAGCGVLESVTIAPGVETIGDLAFNLTYALRDITLPEGVTTIGTEVFSCSGLQTITLPASLKEVGSGFFFWCYDLTDVYFGGTREQWEALDGPAQLKYLPDTQVHFA